MKNFFLITNAYKDKKNLLSRQIQDYIQMKGGRCTFTEGSSECDVSPDISVADIPADTECIMVLGGDGTLIRASAVCAACNLPMIGVNLGHLGYLCELEESTLFEAIDQIMGDEYLIEERMMLSGRVISADDNADRHSPCTHPQNVVSDQIKLSQNKSMEEITALNDIVVSRKGALQLLQIIIFVNGEYLNTLHGDGIIVATPTGSTAYNMSAGGPIVDPKAEMILLTPINDHNLNSKSIIISAEDDILLEIGTRRSDKKEFADVSFDGEHAIEAGVGDKIQIHIAKQKTKILKLSNLSFLEILRRKMQVYKENV